MSSNRSFSSIVYFVIGSEVKNIYIYGNINLTDQEIIELAKLQDYPNFYTTSSNKIENNIKKNPLIKKVKVKKRFFQQSHSSRIVKLHTTFFLCFCLYGKKLLDK